MWKTKISKIIKDLKKMTWNTGNYFDKTQNLCFSHITYYAKENCAKHQEQINSPRKLCPFSRGNKIKFQFYISTLLLLKLHFKRIQFSVKLTTQDDIFCSLDNVLYPWCIFCFPSFCSEITSFILGQNNF